MKELLQKMISFKGVSHENALIHEVPDDLLRFAGRILTDAGYAVLIITGGTFPSFNLLAVPEEVMRCKRENSDSMCYSNLILFSGHCDVVPYKEYEWKEHPRHLREENGMYYGRGCCDMRGFLCAAVRAATDAVKEGLNRPALLITSDEETSMYGAQLISDLFTDRIQDKSRLQAALSFKGCKESCSLFTDQGEFVFDGEKLIGEDVSSLFANERFAAAVIGEPTDGDIVIRHKGWMACNIKLRGRSGHSSLPETGLNVIPYAAECIRLIEKFREEVMMPCCSQLKAEDRPTVNFGTVNGGTSHNCICDLCTIGFDMRPVSEFGIEKAAAVTDYIREHLHLPEGMSMETERPYADVPPFAEYDEEVIEKIRQCAAEDSKVKSVSFCTEAPFISAFAPTVICGPGSITCAHIAEECISKEDLERCLVMLKKLLR